MLTHQPSQHLNTHQHHQRQDLDAILDSLPHLPGLREEEEDDDDEHEASVSTSPLHDIETHEHIPISRSNSLEEERPRPGAVRVCAYSSYQRSLREDSVEQQEAPVSTNLPSSIRGIERPSARPRSTTLQQPDPTLAIDETTPEVSVLPLQAQVVADEELFGEFLSFMQRNVPQAEIVSHPLLSQVGDDDKRSHRCVVLLKILAIVTISVAMVAILGVVGHRTFDAELATLKSLPKRFFTSAPNDPLKAREKLVNNIPKGTAFNPVRVSASVVATTTVAIDDRYDSIQPFLGVRDGFGALVSSGAQATYDEMRHDRIAQLAFVLGYFVFARTEKCLSKDVDMSNIDLVDMLAGFPTAASFSSLAGMASVVGMLGDQSFFDVPVGFVGGKTEESSKQFKVCAKQRRSVLTNFLATSLLLLNSEQFDISNPKLGVNAEV